MVLGDSGIDSGDLLVATTSGPADDPSPERRHAADAVLGAAGSRVGPLVRGRRRRGRPRRLVRRASADDSDLATVAVGLLVLAAVVGVLPVGRLAHHRALAAPAFGAAAAFAVVWDPQVGAAAHGRRHHRARRAP